jgi:hypothetical protein
MRHGPAGGETYTEEKYREQEVKQRSANQERSTYSLAPIGEQGPWFSFFCQADKSSEEDQIERVFRSSVAGKGKKTRGISQPKLFYAQPHPFGEDQVSEFVDERKEAQHCDSSEYDSQNVPPASWKSKFGLAASIIASNAISHN